jgi:ABC-2 type transport system ATP-binding protein
MTADATSQAVIDVSALEKTFKGKVRALRGVDMRVERGEIFGLLGPNGAGKSTLVKILMTIVRPTSGGGTMLSAPIGDKGVLRRIGYLPEHLRFPDYLTGQQALDFYAAMDDVPRADRRRKAAKLLDLVGMTEWQQKSIKGYSKGMKQRLGIAQALMNEPEVVFLDEPTDGVDPVGRRDIREVLVRLRDEGVTVFLNSHLLSELEMVCERVAILVKGVVAQQGTIADLTKGQARYEIEVSEDGAAEAASLMEAIGVEARERSERRCVGALDSGEKVEATPGKVSVWTLEAARVQPLLDALREKRLMIRSLRPVRPSLEDLFMQAVTDPKTGETLTPGAERNGEKGRRARKERS